MDKNIESVLETNTNKSVHQRFEIINYTSRRNDFWITRYPVSKILYSVAQVLGWIITILSVFGIFSLLLSGGLMKEFALIIVVFALVSGIMLLFLSEMILFQIDKNFFAYLSVHNLLENKENNLSLK